MTATIIDFRTLRAKACVSASIRPRTGIVQDQAEYAVMFGGPCWPGLKMNPTPRRGRSALPPNSESRGGRNERPPPSHDRQAARRRGFGESHRCARPGTLSERSVNVGAGRLRGAEWILVHSHAGDDALACKDYIRERLGICREVRVPVEPRCNPVVVPSSPDSKARTHAALPFWYEAISPHGTPVEAYLNSRGLALPPAGEQVLRWHRSCPFDGIRHGAMIALVRNVTTNEPQAIHRTLIKEDGRKGEVNGKSRAALGPIKAGAIKLVDDADVSLALGVAEGIETTLSMHLLPEFGARPAWACISAGGMSAFPVLSGVEALWIGVDSDNAGVSAAEEVASRWHAAGREAYLIRPTQAGQDLNDVTRGGCDG